MIALRNLLFLFFTLGVSTVALGQASLLVTADLDCTWKLDGKSQGQLKADDATSVKVSSGKHLVQATSIHGASTFRAVVDVSLAQELVEIKLKVAQSKQPAIAGRVPRSTAQSPTWTDPSTGLMWPREDNGLYVTWAQAQDYCQNLSLGGYHDWQLPSLGELKGIYDPNSRSTTKGGIRVEMHEWSNSPSSYRDQAWSFDFVLGLPSEQSRDLARFYRALCVRHP